MDEKTTIVIPVFNQVNYTRGCLESLLQDSLRPNYEIIVVDNGSSDGTAEYLQEIAAQIASQASNDSFQVIKNQENRGVAVAWNQGLKAATSNWVAILNNDILLSRGWWDGLRDAMEEKKLALASPYVLEGARPQKLDDWSQRFCFRNRGKVRKDYCFVLFALRRKLVDEVGYFDEGYKIGGYEDRDYIYRLRQKGLPYGVVGGAAIYHFGSVTLGEFKKTGDKHAAENLRYFQEKWQVDPRKEDVTWSARWTRRWRRIKKRFDYI